MSVDGIGRPPPGGIDPAGGAVAPGHGEGFNVEPAVEPGLEPPALLDRVQSGELSVEQYLEQRVSEALSPWSGRLSAAELDFVRSSLRAELETDPVLVELARRATSGAGAGNR